MSPIEVPCVKCGAPAGAPCRTPGHPEGRPDKHYAHAARFSAVERLRELAKEVKA